MIPLPLLAYLAKPWVKYLLIGIVVSLALVELRMMWNHFIADPLREEGRQEVQARFDAHLLDDKQAELKARDERRAKESLDQIQSTAIINQLYEEKDHAIQAKDAELADLRAGTISMRTFTGTAVSQADAGMPDAQRSTEGSHETCTVSFPAEAGELVIAAKHEAVEVAARLAACQAWLEKDRNTSK